MISEQAYFVKDWIWPKGSVTIRKNTCDLPRGSSADIAEHTTVEQLRLHSSETDKNGNLVHDDQILDAPKQPEHDELCLYEQEYFLKAIQEDLDLSTQQNDVVDTWQIVLTSDDSVT